MKDPNRKQYLITAFLSTKSARVMLIGRQMGDIALVKVSMGTASRTRPMSLPYELVCLKRACEIHLSAFITVFRCKKNVQ